MQITFKKKLMNKTYYHSLLRTLLLGPSLLLLFTMGCQEPPAVYVEVAPANYFNYPDGSVLTNEPTEVTIINLDGIAVCYNINNPQAPLISDTGLCSTSNAIRLKSLHIIPIEGGCSDRTIKMSWQDPTDKSFYTTSISYSLATPTCVGTNNVLGAGKWGEMTFEQNQ